MKYLRVIAVAMVAILAFNTANAQVKHRKVHHLRLLKHHGHRTVHHR